MNIPLSVPNKKIIVAHAKAMDMTCSGNLEFVIIGTIQTITSPWVLPLIALKTKPLETRKMTMTDVFVITPGQEVAPVIIILQD